MPSTNNTRILIPLSFLVVYLVWGSTYLFLAYVVDEFPPYLAVAIRYSGASLILFTLAFSLGQLKGATSNQIKNALIAGVLFIGVGSGSVSWVLQRLDSGFTALLIATQPLVTVNMVWLLNKKRPTKFAFFGVFLGLIGSYLLISQKEILATTDEWFAVLLLFISIIVWAYGTIFVNKSDLPKNFVVNTAYQLFAGSVFVFIVSLLTENQNIDWVNISRKAWSSMAFLIVFGGTIVFVAFNYLLKESTPERVSTTTYVNPIIAVVLGWAFNSEMITNQTMIAAVFMLTGVVFINFEWGTIKRFLRID